MSIRYRTIPIERAYERAPSYSTIPKETNVTFLLNHYQRSKLLLLNKFNAWERVIETAHDLFPTNGYYRLYSDSILGTRNELTNSTQILDCVRNLNHVLPQLTIRLEEYLPRRSRNHYEEIPLTRNPSRHSLRVRFNDPLHNNRIYEGFTILCSHCHAQIIGSRYHCLTCSNYVLCGSCERDLVHFEHALLRIVNHRVTSIPDYVLANAPSYVFPEEHYYVERVI